MIVFWVVGDLFNDCVVGFVMFYCELECVFFYDWFVVEVLLLCFEYVLE